MAIALQMKLAADQTFDSELQDIEEKEGFLPLSSTVGARHCGELERKSVLSAQRRTIPNVALAAAVLVLFAIGYIIAYVAVGFTRYGHQIKVNVILCIADGFGPASETFARSYTEYLHKTNSSLVQPGGRWAFSSKKWRNPVPTSDSTPSPSESVRLPLDTMLVGQSRTRSSNSLVTDSAAGATAFACGIKSYNGAIAVDPVELQPCATVLEAAKHKGYLTGLVATSRITHATPAAFYAHVADRDDEMRIAEMLVGDFPLGIQVDYALGGGRCFFLPNATAGSCRSDAADLIKVAEDNTIRVIADPSHFDALPSDASGLGTFGLFNLDHMHYEADRHHMRPEIREPSLKDMTMKALSVLANGSRSRKSHGFFLMVEGSRIDMAGHSNDPVGHLYDILAYEDMISEVKEFVDTQNNAGWPTVMISVSDHETGGMALARQLDPNQYPDYRWFPDAIENATHSTFWSGRQIARSGRTEDIIREMAAEFLGLRDLSDGEVSQLQAAADDPWALDRYLADMLSKRALVGWSTSGHSGVDVNLYAYGWNALQLNGNRDNTEIGLFIERNMGLQLSASTREMRLDSKSWHTIQRQAANATLLDVARYHLNKRPPVLKPVASGAPANHLYLPSNDPSML